MAYRNDNVVAFWNICNYFHSRNPNWNATRTFQEALIAIGKETREGAEDYFGWDEAKSLRYES